MKTDRESYRKGVMFGLTLAEIMILILFLLMTVLCILWQKQKRMADAIANETMPYRAVVNKNDGDPEKRKLIEDIVEDAEIIAEAFSQSSYSIAPMEEIGEIDDDMKLVIDENGNAVGYVGEDSIIKDFDGEELGKIDDDGVPVDDDGNVLGKIVEDKKIVRNKKGRPIGYADKKGNVVSPDGELIGTADKTGTVRKNVVAEKSANRTIIGYFDGKDVRDFRGNVIGKLNEANKVLDATGTVSGAMTAPGYVVRNPSGTVVGYVTGSRRVKGQVSETVGIVDDNGDVFATTGDVIASVSDCSAIVFDADEKPVGYIRRDNSVAGFSHKKKGVADYNGRILDEKFEWMGHTGRRVVWIVSSAKNYKAFITETNKMYSINGDEIGVVVNNGVLTTDTVFLAGGVNIAQLIRDGGGRIAGYLMNGKAVSTSGQPLSFDENGGVSDANGETVGTLREIVSPARKDGVIVGFVGRNGHFFDFNGVEKGVIDLAGDVWRSSMKKIDRIEIAFRSKDDALVKPREIGAQTVVFEQVSPVRNAAGDIIGSVDDDMFFFDLNGRRKGAADIYGKIAESALNEQPGTIANKAPLIETTRRNSDIAAFMKHAVQSMEITETLPIHRMKEDILNYRNNEKRLLQEITDLKGWKSNQIRQMRLMDEERRAQGKKPLSRDRPPCWVRQTGEETFEEEIPFHIELLKNGFTVHNVSPDGRKEDFKGIPDIPLNALLSFRDFDRYTKKILAWEKEQDCRFRVRICDRTENDKNAYKKGMEMIEKRFYKERKESCDGL